MLYKPAERVMRMTLVLQDLLKHTPHRHPDFPVLREVGFMCHQGLAPSPDAHLFHSDLVAVLKLEMQSASIANNSEGDLNTTLFVNPLRDNVTHMLHYC